DWGKVVAQRANPVLYIFERSNNFLPTRRCPETEKKMGPAVEAQLWFVGLSATWVPELFQLVRVERIIKSELIATIQKEILRHDFRTFVENPPSVAQGGRGVVVPGCTTCNKRARLRLNSWSVSPMT